MGNRNQFFSFLVISLTFFCLPVSAQQQTAVHPQQANQHIQLQAMQVDGFEPTLHKHVSQEDLQFQIALERGRFGDQLSIDELHQIADALTLFFRKRGYAFHSVYLPPQTVKAGLVILRLQPGVLGDVHVINQGHYPDKLFARPFEPLLSKILYAPDIEQRVQAIKMQAGYSVFAFFSRGAEAGEARLNLRTEDTRKRSFSLKADNYGSDSSGKHRLLGSYSEYQLTGHNDTLSLSLLRVLDDVDNTYGSILYKLPFAGLRYELTASMSTNQFEVGDRLAELGLTGETRSWSIGLTRFSDFHPSSRSSWQLYVSQKESELGSDFGFHQTEDSASLNLAWQKRWQSSEGTWILQSNMDLAGGRFEASNHDDSGFTKLSFSEFLLGAFSEGRSRNIWQMNLRGQYSAEALPVAETLSLTGIYGVRGYPPSVFTAERGALLSLEWRWPNLLNKTDAWWRIEPFLHADWGYGEDGDGAELSRAEYASAGVGLRLNFGRHVSAQATFAKGMNGQVDEAEVEDDDQVLFEIRWQ